MNPKGNGGRTNPTRAFLSAAGSLSPTFKISSVEPKEHESPTPPTQAAPAQHRKAQGGASGEVTQTHPRGHLVGKGLLRFNHRLTAKQTQEGPGGRPGWPRRKGQKCSRHAGKVTWETTEPRALRTQTPGCFSPPNKKS